MAKKNLIPAIDGDDGGPGWWGGDGRKNKIIQETGKEIKKDLESASKEHLDESKEQLDLPDIIICRRHANVRNLDMEMLEKELPQVLGSVKCFSSPDSIIPNIKKGKKTIVFMGQIFDNMRRGDFRDYALDLHRMKDVEVNLITSMPYPSEWRGLFNRIYRIEGLDSWSEMIVNHLKESIPALNVKAQEKEMLLNRKLEFLHELLGAKVPKKIPEKLKKYEKEFDEFREKVRWCIDGLDPAYIDALRVFRDVLLNDR